MIPTSSRQYLCGMGCKAQTAAIAGLLRGFVTPQTARKDTDPSGWGAIGRFLRAASCMGGHPCGATALELVPIAIQRGAVETVNTLLHHVQAAVAGEVGAGREARIFPGQPSDDGRNLFRRTQSLHWNAADDLARGIRHLFSNGGGIPPWFRFGGAGS